MSKLFRTATALNTTIRRLREMPKRPASPDASASTPTKRTKSSMTNPVASSSSNPSDPLSIDYYESPHLYRILRGEMNVFKTNPYSAELKALWRFKDEAAARKSSEALWERFLGYREKEDFVGMDVTRKFLQMGYTRSTRYALRPGGRKYSPSTGAEIPRTGEIADQEKYNGSLVFKRKWAEVEDDEVYTRLRAEWEVGVEGKKRAGVRQKIKVEGDKLGERDVKEESPLRSVKAEPDEEGEVKIKPEPSEESEPRPNRASEKERKPPPQASGKLSTQTRSRKHTVKDEQRDAVKSEPPDS